MNKDTVFYRKSISETNIHSNIDDKNLLNKKSEKIMNSNKHRNKILKEHGNQSLITYLNEFNQLINHTNRLFLYRCKISPQKQQSVMSSDCKQTKNNINKICKNPIEKQLKSKIIGKINGIIHDLEMKPKIEITDNKTK